MLRKWQPFSLWDHFGDWKLELETRQPHFDKVRWGKKHQCSDSQMGCKLAVCPDFLNHFMQRSNWKVNTVGRSWSRKSACFVYNLSDQLTAYVSCPFGCLSQSVSVFPDLSNKLCDYNVIMTDGQNKTPVVIPFSFSSESTMTLWMEILVKTTKNKIQVVWKWSLIVFGPCWPKSIREVQPQPTTCQNSTDVICIPSICTWQQEGAMAQSTTWGLGQHIRHLEQACCGL